MYLCVIVCLFTLPLSQRGPVALRTLSSLPPYDTGLDSLRPMTSGTASVSSHGYKAAASGETPLVLLRISSSPSIDSRWFVLLYHVCESVCLCLCAGKQSPPRSTSLAAASPAATGVLPPTLFDELTDAVIEGCRARFWSTFLDSPLFMQYLKVL